MVSQHNWSWTTSYCTSFEAKSIHPPSCSGQVRFPFSHRPFSDLNFVFFFLLFCFVGNQGEYSPFTSSLCSPESLVDRIATAVPHFLVLHASVVDDSDGATLVIRTLGPKPASPKVHTWLKRRLSSHPGPFQPQPPTSKDKYQTQRTGDEHVRSLLNGPFAELRPLTIEARVVPSDTARATQFSRTLLDRAYISPVNGQKIRPYRKFRVLVNPSGGPGKAKQEWEGKVRPILEAAGCELDTTITKHRNHGLEIVLTEPKLAERYDGILSVSGDGMVHEILNGIAGRPDAEHVFRNLAVVPVPTGSGNATSVSLLGPAQGSNLAQAALNAIKGLWLDMDICVVTQPAAQAQNSPHPKAMLDLVRTTKDAQVISRVEQDEAQGFVRYYSFLSTAVGLMADLDIGTEHLRMLGDARFMYGYLHCLLMNDRAPVKVDVKLGPSGTVNRKDMRDRVDAHQDQTTQTYNTPAVEQPNVLDQPQPEPAKSKDQGKGMFDLECGTVLDPLGDEALPELDLYDPSWPATRSLQGGPLKSSSTGAAQGWTRMRRPITSLYTGKLPYVSRELLQFPYAVSGDGLIDVALMLHDGGRSAKIRALDLAGDGKVVYDKAMAYFKAQAIRVTPDYPAGHPKLRKGGIISIDGERVPYAPFQIEVARGAALRTFSLYGNFFMEHHWPSS